MVDSSKKEAVMKEEKWEKIPGTKGYRRIEERSSDAHIEVFSMGRGWMVDEKPLVDTTGQVLFSFMGEVEKVVGYYFCKECGSDGSIRGGVARCPICSSNHVSLFTSQAEFVKQTGRN
jgi:rubrerythrin